MSDDETSSPRSDVDFEICVDDIERYLELNQAEYPEGVPEASLYGLVSHPKDRVKRAVAVLEAKDTIHIYGPRGARKVKRGPRPKGVFEGLTTNSFTSDDGGKRFKLNGKPVIIHDKHWERMASETAQDLAVKGFWCSEGNTLVKISEDEAGPDGLLPKRLIEISPEALEYAIAEASTFVDLDPQGDDKPDRVTLLPPPGIPKRWDQLMYTRGQYPELSRVKRIKEVKFYRPDGTLFHTPGYDPITGVIYSPRKEVPLPSDLSQEAAIYYAAELLDVVSDFPMTDQDLSVFLALMITAAMREALFTAPLFGLDATAPGSGKTNLARIASWIACGSAPSLIPFRSNEDEFEKTIAATVLSGSPFLLFDNLNAPLGCAFLDSALSTDKIDMRPLGTSKIVKDASTRTTFVATGNGLEYLGDTNRRVVSIRLVPHEVDPSKRNGRDGKGWKIPNIIPWVIENAARLNSLLLGITEAYRLAGRPIPEHLGSKPDHLGGFEMWGEYVRFCVMWVGLPDPLNSRTRLEARNDITLVKSEIFRAMLKKDPEGKNPASVHAIASLPELKHGVLDDFKDEGGKIGRRVEKLFAKFDGARAEVEGKIYYLAEAGRRAGKPIYAVRFERDATEQDRAEAKP